MINRQHRNRIDLGNWPWYPARVNSDDESQLHHIMTQGQQELHHSSNVGIVQFFSPPMHYILHYNISQIKRDRSDVVFLYHVSLVCCCVSARFILRTLPVEAALKTFLLSARATSVIPFWVIVKCSEASGLLSPVKCWKDFAVVGHIQVSLSGSIKWWNRCCQSFGNLGKIPTSPWITDVS